MANESVTTFTPLLKQWYTDERVQDLTFDGNVLFSLLPKNPKAGGITIDVPIRYGNPQGASSDFTTARANKTGSKSAKFQATLTKEYGLVSADRFLIETSKDKKAAFMQVVEPLTNGMLETNGRSCGIHVFGDGSGSKAQIASIATNTLTLTSQYDIVKFQVGEFINVAATKTGGAIRTGSVSILAIDSDAKTLLCSGAIGSWAANDYIYRAGDYDNVLTGLGSWIPSTSGAVGTLFGVDRTLNKDWLGGIRYNGAGLPIVEAITNGTARLNVFGGGRPTHCVMHPAHVASIRNSESSKIRYMDQQVSKKVSFGMAILSVNGSDLKIVEDRYAPTDRAHLLDMSTWKCYSTGQVPDIFDKGNDQRMLRHTDEDAYELRTGGYLQLMCNAPGRNGVVLLDALT